MSTRYSIAKGLKPYGFACIHSYFVCVDDVQEHLCVNAGPYLLTESSSNRRKSDRLILRLTADLKMKTIAETDSARRKLSLSPWLPN